MRVRAVTVAFVLVARVAVAKTAVIGAEVEGRAPEDAIVEAVAKQVPGATLFGAELVAALGGVGGENALLDGRAAVAVSNRVTRGLQAWRAGEFERAVLELRPARDELLAHPAWLAEDVAHRELLRSALIGLGLSLKRLGKGDAIEVMGEEVRSFPEGAPDRQTFGPEVIEFHGVAKRGLEARGRGRLRVTVADPDAIVFVNERFEGAGAPLDRGDLLPGTYRVFARHGARVGRVHLVEVRPGAMASLEIELDLEENVDVAAGRATLREIGGAAATRTVGRLITRLAVHQIAIVRVRGGQTLVEILGRSGERVAHDGAPHEPTSVPATPSPASTSAGPWYRDSWGWALAGVGGAGLAGGGYLLWSASSLDADGRDEPDPREARDLFDRADRRATWGWVTLGAAAVVAAGGVWKLMATEAGSRSSIAVTANGVQVWGTF